MSSTDPAPDAETAAVVASASPAASERAAVAALAGVDGWLTEAQAERLWRAAGSVRPGGRIVEIGSFRGRSTIALAFGAPDAELVAIDPHAGNDRGPREIHGFEDEAAEDHAVFHANLERAGVADRVRHVRRFAADAAREVAGPIDLLFVDGAHRLGPARDDLRRWGDRVVPGGRLLVHDAFSSVGVTLALAVTVGPSGRFRYEGRTGSLVEYSAVAGGLRSRLASIGRQLVELPWFVRNVLVKLAIVAHARPLARALGHDGETWPY